MKFSLKLSAALMSLTVVCVAGVCVVIEQKLERRAHQEFVTRFTAVGNTVAAAAVNAEANMDTLAANALLTIRASEGTSVPLSWDAYQRLAASVGVAGLYVYDWRGNTVAWPGDLSDLDIRLFDFCYDYHTMGQRSDTPWITPFLHSFLDNPAKFAMMPSLDGQRIFSIKLESTAMGRFLQEAVAADPHIREARITTQAGSTLASAHGLALPASDDLARFEFSIPGTAGDCCQCVQTGLVENGPGYGYRLILEVSRDSLVTALRTGRVELAMIFCAICATAGLLALLLARRLSLQLEAIDTVAADLVAAHDFAVPANRTELSRLSATLDALAARLRNQADVRAEAVKSRDLARIAQNVAHDIRSPVAALQVASEQATGLDEMERTLIQAAAERIRAIADDLLEAYSGQAAAGAGQDKIADVVMAIVSEKRALYARLDVSWPLTLGQGVADMRVGMSGVAVGRFLSNLVDNAVEALCGAPGLVEVSLRRERGMCVIAIRDTGCGIAEADIPRVVGGGVSLNKAHGNGVGLHSARRSIEAAGGSLTLTSVVGDGTTVTLKLPLSSATKRAAA